MNLPARMSDTPSTTEDDAIQEAAIAWYVRLQDPIATDADRRAFAAWLDARPEHRDAYAQIRNLWAELEQPARKLGQESHHRRRQAALLPALAACLVLGLGALLLGWRDPGMLQRWQADYATGPGEQASFTLADGSRVFLDSGSALSFDPDAVEGREAHLLRGRAWFDVAAVPGRRFHVQHGELRVEVLGTAFDVSTYGPANTITVERGRVGVSWRGQALLGHSLGAGDHLRYVPGQAPRLSHVESDLISVWREGLYVFDKTPLKEVMRILESNRAGRILIAADIAELPVTGVFRQSEPDAMLAGLTASLGLKTVGIPGLGVRVSR